MASVGSVMQKHIVGVSKSTRVEAAVKLIERSSVFILPVMDGERLVGLLTRSEVDALSSDIYKEGKVGEIMIKDFKFVEEDADVDEAARVMLQNRLARLPVVNNKREMKCVGIISSTDIVKNRK